MAFSYYHIVASVNTHIINKHNTAVLLLVLIMDKYQKVNNYERYTQ